MKKPQCVVKEQGTSENGPVLAVFERYEKKYLLSEKKYRRLMAALAGHVQLDVYGKHTICNIYYDTQDYGLIRHSIGKPKYKEKLRLRSYGIPDMGSTVFLEIKKKCDKTVYKRRIALSLKEAEDYLQRGIKLKNKGQIAREIDYFIKFYKPEPKLYLAYDREAYFGVADSELRITIDSGIRSREGDLCLEHGDAGVPLLKETARLMEIKVPSAMPLWLVELLSDLEIYSLSFSKYGNIYKRQLYTERGQQPCFQAF